MPMSRQAKILLECTETYGLYPAAFISWCVLAKQVMDTQTNSLLVLQSTATFFSFKNSSRTQIYHLFFIVYFCITCFTNQVFDALV